MAAPPGRRPTYPLEWFARIGLESQAGKTHAEIIELTGTNEPHVSRAIVQLCELLDHEQLFEDFKVVYRNRYEKLGRPGMQMLANQTQGNRVDLDVVRKIPINRAEALEYFKEHFPNVNASRRSVKKRPTTRDAPNAVMPEMPDWPESRPAGRKPPSDRNAPDRQPNPVASPLDEVQKRIVTKNNLVAKPKKPLPDGLLRDEIGKKLAQVLYYIDATSLGKAKLSELAQMMRVLFEAKQLLDGKPTTILNREEKQELHNLFPKLLAEAKRRAMSLNMMKDVKGKVIDQAKEGAE